MKRHAFSTIDPMSTRSRIGTSFGWMCDSKYTKVYQAYPLESCHNPCLGIATGRDPESTQIQGLELSVLLWGLFMLCTDCNSSRMDFLALLHGGQGVWYTTRFD